MRSSTRQPWRDGTGVASPSGAAAACSSASRMAWPSARIAGSHSSLVPCVLAIASPGVSGPSRASQPRLGAVPDVSATPPGVADPTVVPRLGTYTTLGLGGPAGRVLTLTDTDEVIQSVQALTAEGEPTLVLGGGSNVVIADEGFPGTVVLLRTRGTRVVDADPGTVTVEVDAGTVWDEVVATAVAEGWSGLECLSGVPGSAGATPIQNVGAYGQEVAEVITGVRVLDRHTGQVVTLPPDRCGFGYRTS